MDVRIIAWVAFTTMLTQHLVIGFPIKSTEVSHLQRILEDLDTNIRMLRLTLTKDTSSSSETDASKDLEVIDAHDRDAKLWGEPLPESEESEKPMTQKEKQALLRQALEYLMERQKVHEEKRDHDIPFPMFGDY